jgi:hypothetical protein
MDAQPPEPHIGLWGTFDLEDFGEVLFPRIARRELARRLPGATIRAFAPFGSERGNRLDGGEPAEPLGSYGPERVAALSRELDCVVVGAVDVVDDLPARYGGDADEVVHRGVDRFFVQGLGPELEAGVPVVWSSVGVGRDLHPGEEARFIEALRTRSLASVRHEDARRRLQVAGVDRPIEVVPDPAVLAPRLFPEELLDRRLDHLRAVGSFPEEGLPLIVQGDRSLAPVAADLAASVASVAERLGGVPVVALDADDSGFAAAVTEALPSAHDASGAGVEDVVAAIRASAGFVGSSPRAAAVALALWRPHVLVGGGAEAEAFGRAIGAPESSVSGVEELPAAFDKMVEAGPRPDVVARLQGAVDEHFDAVARLAAEAAWRMGVIRRRDEHGVRDRLEAVLAAYHERGRLLARQRWTLADRVRDAEARERATRERLEAQAARWRSEAARLEAEVAGKDRELRTLLHTRTFRYTAGLRRAWGAIRGLFRR